MEEMLFTQWQEKCFFRELVALAGIGEPWAGLEGGAVSLDQHPPCCLESQPFPCLGRMSGNVQKGHRGRTVRSQSS